MKRLSTFGLVFLLLFVGMSTYAVSDAGSELGNWSERALRIVFKTVDSESSSNLNQLALTLSQEEENQLAEADKEVALLSTLISEDSNKGIQNYQLRYISIADETEKELAKKNFNALKSEQIQKVEAELEEDFESILADILQ